MPKRINALLVRRNAAIHKRHLELKAKYPQWRATAIVEKVADEFYLSVDSVYVALRNFDEAEAKRIEAERKEAENNSNQTKLF